MRLIFYELPCQIKFQNLWAPTCDPHLLLSRILKLVLTSNFFIRQLSWIFWRLFISCRRSSKRVMTHMLEFLKFGGISIELQMKHFIQTSIVQTKTTKMNIIPNISLRIGAVDFLNPKSSGNGNTTWRPECRKYL